MTEQNYTYAVARIRAKEMSLLGQAALEQLLGTKSYEECLRLLIDKGWGQNNEQTADALLAAENEKTWQLMKELVGDLSVFETFFCLTDFHNLKAAIKGVYLGTQHPESYMVGGTVPPETLYHIVFHKEWKSLPQTMARCGEEAFGVLFQTGDVQLCDAILDQGALVAMQQAVARSGNPLFERYSELRTATANIQIALRSYKTGKDRRFLTRALVPCKSLDVYKLIEGIGEGEEALYRYVEMTAYSDVVEVMKQAPSALEKWCDNLLMREIQKQKYNPFTLSPLAAYVLARENEIKTVRMILVGKRNHLPGQWMRERLREMYV